jgi:hypothetical protein
MIRPPRFLAPRRTFGRGGPQVSYSETIAELDHVGSKPRIGWGNARPHTVGMSMGDAVRHDETLPATTDDVGGSDQRCAPRFTLLIRAAKLISPEGEFLCVVRDASETGVSVRLFHPLPANVPLTLEMPNGDCLALERVWEEEGKAGFRFADQIDIERIVESPSRFARRAVRVNVDVPCELLVGIRRIQGQDPGRGHARDRRQGPLAPGRQLRPQLRGHLPVRRAGRAHVRTAPRFLSLGLPAARRALTGS